MKRLLPILLLPVGLIVALTLVAVLFLALNFLFDWHFALYVVPTGAAIALLVAGAINWWSLPERHRQ